MVGGRQQSTGSWWPDFTSIGSACKLGNSQDVDNLQLKSLYITVDQRLDRCVYKLATCAVSEIHHNLGCSRNEWMNEFIRHDLTSKIQINQAVLLSFRKDFFFFFFLIKTHTHTPTHLSPTTTQTTQATNSEWVASQIPELRHRCYSTCWGKKKQRPKNGGWSITTHTGDEHTMN